MALDELRRRIERDAEAEASRIGKEADAAAERIVGDARKEADSVKKRARAAAEEEARLAKADAMVGLEAESEGMLRAAREDAVERQLGQFTALVKRGLGAREREIIKSAIRDFSLSVPPERTSARISGKNADILGKAAVGKIVRAGVRGVVLSSLDGRITADATVDGIAESNADLIRRALAGRLFR